MANYLSAEAGGQFPRIEQERAFMFVTLSAPSFAVRTARNR
jgi:hypothetical protein